MSPEVTETRLPGIGVRYSFATRDGDRISVILRTDGDSELYVFGKFDGDKPRAVVDLTESEARQLGAILGGAYERPRIIEDLGYALGELQIEWIPVPDDSPAIGHTLDECRFRARTKITIIAILREPEPVVGAQPGDVIKTGDTLVTAGTRASYGEFRRLLAEGPIPES